MPAITIICSAHRENGLCNAPALVRMLRTFQPEVAFLEMQPTGDDSARTLEAKALANYGESTAIQQVIVEQEEAPKDLYPEIQMVFDSVERASEEYLALLEQDDCLVRSYGFEYLNSELFLATRTRLSEIEDGVVRRTRDQRLIRALERWRLVNRKRENEMVRNIYEYARRHVFRRGVFLVGAAHRAGVGEAISLYANRDVGSLAWTLEEDDRRCPDAS